MSNPYHSAPYPGYPAPQSAYSLLPPGHYLEQGQFGAILVVTMMFSDLMNNAATAAVMCPIALGTAAQLGVNADPFLMAVAVGASYAFLYPYRSSEQHAEIRPWPPLPLGPYRSSEQHADSGAGRISLRGLLAARFTVGTASDSGQHSDAAADLAAVRPFSA